MVKVITYGSYDVLHYGHIRLLERAKALGDYLIVGVTSDDYDKTRGKINLKQSLMERIEAVKATGIPDEVIIEEYEGQKIDDIIKYDVDIFTVGSDWVGYFDYLKEYCQVVYLERTNGISSSEIRTKDTSLKIGILGSASYLEKVVTETQFVNGVEIPGVYSENINLLSDEIRLLPLVTNDIDELLGLVNAVYVHSFPAVHYLQVKKALTSGKHVLCESPIALKREQCLELYSLAEKNQLILMEAIRTAYSTAYQRMLLLIKAGKIGHVLSVDATCTSLKNVVKDNDIEFDKKWNSISAWGPTGLLPVFQILGCKYKQKKIISHIDQDYEGVLFDTFTKVGLIYSNATASIKVGRGVKSEGELIISGTKGYIYVPAPWWKTDYFEIRYERPENNRRYFYQLDGEGIRYELVAFAKAIQSGKFPPIIDRQITSAITGIIEDFYSQTDVVLI